MKILILLLLLPFNIFAAFTTLSTQQVQAKIAQGVTIIDVRRQDEYNKYGIISGAHKMTFFDAKGQYNAQQWLDNLAKVLPNKNAEFILVCAHANRTKTIGHFLNTKTAYKNIFELDGGINYGWIDKGLATTKIASRTDVPWYQFW